MSKWQQHGDVQLIPIDVIPDDAKSIGTRSVVQEGEMTGHAHRLPMGVPMFQNPAGDVFMDIPRRIDISHEEHKPQLLKPGFYKIGRVVEYDYDRQEQRAVAD